MYTTYIRDAGYAFVSRKIAERTGNIKWLIRETPIALDDSGWRVLSDRDTAEYIRDSTNLFLVDFNDICNSSPPASASTTCRSAPTSNWSSSPTAAGDGSITRPRRRFRSAD